MKTILVPIDFSDLTPILVRTAGEWAAATGRRVHLFHVMPEEVDLVGYESGLQMIPYMPPPEDAEENRFMQVYKDQLTVRGLEVTTRVVKGAPALDILDEALAVEADLIILGSHRHGALHHLLLGSVSGAVLKRAPCPVLLVPAPQPKATHSSEKVDETPVSAKV
jgi:nucleotide-binding universal stress UspA family protein